MREQNHLCRSNLRRSRGQFRVYMRIKLILPSLNLRKIRKRKSIVAEILRTAYFIPMLVAIGDTHPTQSDA
jgi:hypothetical protein